jgi:hypothetical protein
MIFIGLDVSKISTALCIEKDENIKLYSYTTKKSNNIWIRNTEEFINYRNICYKYDSEKDYSKSEIIKLKEFNSITDLIIDDIFNNVDKKDKVKIAIEGYSYNSKGPIFDLIEFTTSLKIKLMKKINHNDIVIFSPLTLKTEACKMVYKPRIELKGKRKIQTIYHYENTKGKQATKFDKWDMFFLFIDSYMKMKIKDWCEQNQAEITKIKEVPKPIDDMIDAIFLKEMIKKLGEE